MPQHLSGLLHFFADDYQDSGAYSREVDMAAITDLTTLAHTDLAVGDWLVVHDLSAATDKKMAPFVDSTWTPALAFGGASTGITYSTQTGIYNRVGILVWIACRLTLTSKGSATGAATITGLPFATSGIYQPLSFAAFSLASNVGGLSAAALTTTIWLYVLPAAGAAGFSLLTDAYIGNTSDLIISGVYRV
jgi:hypothetical protein